MGGWRGGAETGSKCQPEESGGEKWLVGMAGLLTKAPALHRRNSPHKCQAWRKREAVFSVINLDLKKDGTNV